MAFIQTAAVDLLDPLINLWRSFVSISYGLLIALIILVIGYLIAMITGHVIKIVIDKLRIDKAIAKLKLPKAMGKLKMSSILGEITKWFIFIIFLKAAVDAVNLGTLSILLENFVFWLPKLIVAVLAVLFGFFLAHYVGHLLERESDMRGIKFVSSLFKIVIIYIAIVIAIEHVGIRVDILQNAFLIILGSIGLGLALAIGLAFGLGMKGQAQGIFEKYRKKL